MTWKWRICDEDTYEDRPAAAEVCRQLDGLPLAIELAVRELEAPGSSMQCSQIVVRFGV